MSHALFWIAGVILFLEVLDVLSATASYLRRAK